MKAIDIDGYTLFFGILLLISASIWLLLGSAVMEPAGAMLTALSLVGLAFRNTRLVLRIFIGLCAIVVFMYSLTLVFPNLFTHQISVPAWIHITALTPALVVAIYLWWRQGKIQQYAIELNALDSKLWRLLTEIDGDPERTEQSLKKIADTFLEDVLGIAKRFNEGFRISVMRPEKDNQDSLCIWSSANMPSESVDRTSFYIGKNMHGRGARGVAAQTFLDGRIRVVKLDQQRNGQWSTRDLDHKIFVKKQPSYRSYITIPIKDDSGHTWGVLCLDSTYVEGCSSNDIQTLLISIADRFASLFVFAKSLAD